MALPSPGHANTDSTNTDPATRPGSESAPSTTSCGVMFRSTCLPYTRDERAPFARAVLTQLSCSTSATALREYRAMPAAPTAASVTTGSTACRARSRKPAHPCSTPPGVRMPNAGSRSACGSPSVAAPYVNTATSASAIQNEEHTSELQSRQYLVCRLLLE